MLNSLVKMREVVFLILILFSSKIISQVDYTVNLNWHEISVSENEEQFFLPIVEGGGFLEDKVSFSWKNRLTNKNLSFKVLDEEFQLANETDIAYIKRFEISLKEKINYDLNIVNDKKDIYLTLMCFPYIIENNQIKKLIRFKLIGTPFFNVNQNKSIKFKDESVLNSGEWYKIPITKDGVYKIDFDYFQKIGVNTHNLKSNSIHLYGNGEGRLPELNSIYRTDDLKQNAILIEDGGDGVIDKGDYILFYGWGPNRWYYDSLNTFRDKNIYSDESYYFLTINTSISSELVLNSNYQSSLTSDSFYDYYDDFQIHELDSVSIMKGGQRWYGEMFDISLNHNLTFDYDNLYTSLVEYEFAIASNSKTQGGNYIEVLINGGSIFKTTLPVGDYTRKKSSFKSSLIPLNKTIQLSVSRNSPSTITYLDYFQMYTKKKIRYSNRQFNFRNFESVGKNKISTFNVSGINEKFMIWEISDKQIPSQINYETVNGIGNFNVLTDTLLEFVVFDPNNVFIPIVGNPIKNQNIHGLPQADLLIVSPIEFIDQANRLADLHRNEGLDVNVVNVKDVYNEFSSGMLDPTAIRDFVRMFYERAKSINDKYPKYLLLFGDGTYDPKNRISNNNNFIPTYQVLNSETSLAAMVTDDYYGMLDENESISSTDMLDIGVGRLLISTVEIANQQVDKIEHYMKNGSVLDVSGSCFGDWRNKYSLIADDEESGYFVVQDAEPNSNYVQDSFPEMIASKIYCDAFQQVSNAGGQRYPTVNEAITNSVEQGALVVNYIGHGGIKGAAEERIITIPQIQGWSNKNHLNLFVSATCEFTKFDDPEQVSAGEWMTLNQFGGAIALMTTTRSVFFGVNTITGKSFYKYVFLRDSLNNPMTFGEIIRLTKNNAGSSDNKRSFTLIGDPALRINLPTYHIVTDSINGYAPEIYVDTVKALSKMKVKAHLEDYKGNKLTSFQGIAQPSVYDKALSKYTLGQDVSSPIIEFKEQSNVLFKGASSIINGQFEFEFIVPKDINYQYGEGKISYYANDNLEDGNGDETRFYVGGIDTTGVEDNLGPNVKIYLNDSTFINGGLTDEHPQFYANLFDESGINTVGNGIGHDIVLILDDQSANPIVLNNYYTANLNTYKSGQVNYQLKDLTEGDHTLLFKVWDVNNNSSQARLNFTVRKKIDVVLSHVLNYPNPFTTSTKFFFEHNQVNQQVQVQIQIFTVTGALVKTINQNLFLNTFRSESIHWDGLDGFGDKIATGVYIYKLTLKNSEGKTFSKVEKLFKI